MFTVWALCEISGVSGISYAILFLGDSKEAADHKFKSILEALQIPYLSSFKV